MSDLSQFDVDTAFFATKDGLLKDIKFCMSKGWAEDAGASARSLVRVCRPDLPLQLIEEPKVWDAKEEESAINTSN